TRIAPEPPTSVITPTEATASCGAFSRNWYLGVTSRFWKPFGLCGGPAWSRWVQAYPIEKPKSEVMRFESSLLIAVSTTDGSVPVFWFETVGSDSSSATKGSSIVIVAGKKRDPAKPWANVPAVGRIVSVRASHARPPVLVTNIDIPKSEESRRSGSPRLVWSRVKSPIGREMALSLYRWSASAYRAGEPTRRNLLPRSENDARSGECDRFKGRCGRLRERRVAMPEAAEGGVVVNRFRSLVSRVVGGVS